MFKSKLSNIVTNNIFIYSKRKTKLSQLSLLFIEKNEFFYIVKKNNKLKNVLKTNEHFEHK